MIAKKTTHKKKQKLETWMPIKNKENGWTHYDLILEYHVTVKKEVDPIVDLENCNEKIKLQSKCVFGFNL